MKQYLYVVISIAMILCISIIFFTSCERDKGPVIKLTESQAPLLPEDTIPEPTVYPYIISFNNHVKPLLAASCVQGCHNPMHPKLDLRPQVAYTELLTQGMNAPYVDTINPQQSTIYLHLVGIYTLMPKGGPKLSQGKIDTIYTWISQGALNN